jgi:hypothetical protein
LLVAFPDAAFREADSSDLRAARAEDLRVALPALSGSSASVVVPPAFAPVRAGFRGRPGGSLGELPARAVARLVGPSSGASPAPPGLDVPDVPDRGRAPPAMPVPPRAGSEGGRRRGVRSPAGSVIR